VLILTIYFLFYSPKLEETRAVAADVPDDRYVELRESRAAGLELLGTYAVNADSSYRLPIDAAMQLVAQEYGGAADSAGAATPRQGGADGDPRAFQDPRYNGLTWLTLNPPPAVRSAGAPGAAPAAPADTAATPARGVLAAPNPVTPAPPAEAPGPAR
jgi:hypothetical protein